MNKTLIASCGAIATIGTVAAIGIVPTSAATEGSAWHEVQVGVDSELVLTGNGTNNKHVITLNPTVSGGSVSSTGIVFGIKANVPWTLDYQAVTGDAATGSTTAAAGTNLGTTGFANTGGYSYAGLNTAATTGNTWGVVFTIGETPVVAEALSTTMSTVTSGDITNGTNVNTTYSAHTDGAVAPDTYKGTIYYYLYPTV